MGIFFRDRQEDLADPDLRASRYFLFKNKQTQENKLKNAEKKYGYTLAELHAYRHLMMPPRMPQRMQEERTDMANTYCQIERLVGVEVYQQQTENHFATKAPTSSSWSNASEGVSVPETASAKSLNADLCSAEKSGGTNGTDEVDERCVKCLGYYLALDRCVRSVSKQDEKNRVYKHTRLHACKPHWVWFNRCIAYRDQQLLKEIHSWETEHVKSLRPEERKDYLDRLQGTKRYLEYAAARSRDDIEVIK
ncbi:hypothetical protein, conserved [Eimeria necatrix]|uniref:Uncharacterized protein n=1 Tax=Eimeria necatrix TaxID=51315 RepID=U6MJN2_9EIME|nr:hypothetical protein, conserved [Eimeria necatrix]CDJ64221.1 hypothetical protein, conserved [Eimeria necatrix]